MKDSAAAAASTIATDSNFDFANINTPTAGSIDNGSVHVQLNARDHESEQEQEQETNHVIEQEHTVDTMKAADAPASILSEKRLCPCCGEMKSLQETFGPKIIAIAIAACRDFAQTFRHNGIVLGEVGSTFRVRASCRKLASLALNVVKEKYPECESFTTSKRSS